MNFSIINKTDTFKRSTMKKHSISQQILQRVEAAVKQTHIDAYKKDGAVCIRQIITGEEIELLREGIESNLQFPSHRVKIASKNEDPGQFIEDFCTWQTNPYYQQFIFESPVSVIAGKLMESKQTRLYHDHLLVKEPGTRQKTPGIRINLTIISKEHKIAVYGYRLIPFPVRPLWNLLRDLIKALGSCPVLLWRTRPSGSQKEALQSSRILIPTGSIIPL